MFKRKESFSEHGNSSPVWHNLLVQPDDKLASIHTFPTRAEVIWLLFTFQPPVLPLFSLSGSPEAGSICHVGVKQGKKEETFC